MASAILRYNIGSSTLKMPYTCNQRSQRNLNSNAKNYWKKKNDYKIPLNQLKYKPAVSCELRSRLLDDVLDYICHIITHCN